VRSIATIGCQIPGSVAELLDYYSKSSLLDYDIVLFKPIQIDFEYAESFNGKPSLADWASSREKEARIHWRREISDAYHTGKIIFIILGEFEEYFVDTGERQYSGAGRNQKVTRLVSPFNNYKAIPVDLGITVSNGKQIRLSDSGQFMAGYWREFERYSVYKLILGDTGGTATFITRTVGSLIRRY